MNKLSLAIAAIALILSGLAFFGTDETSQALGGVTNYDQIGLATVPGCIEFYATSTATKLRMTASTTPTLPPGAAAVMTAAYGGCS